MPEFITTPDFISQYPNNPKSHPPAPTAPEFKSFKWNWPMEVIDAPGAWMVPRLEKEVILAAVDSGLYVQHLDLKGLKILGPPDMSDEDGHGTAVIGIAAARHNTAQGTAGVCPDLAVYPVKVEWAWTDIPWTVLQHDEFSRRAKEALSQIAAADVSLPEIKVVILPLGVSCKNEKQAESYARYYYMGVIERLLMDEVIVVIAPPNDDIPPNRSYPAILKKLLAQYPNLFLVSGCTRTFSGLWGRDMTERFPAQKDVDIFAPGSEQHTLKKTGPEEYNIPPDPPGKNTPRCMAGNSLSIPYVGGLAALLFKINPSLSGIEVSHIIRETAELQDRGTSGIKVIHAFGAALTAYNRLLKPDVKKLNGYRLIMPLEYAGGYVRINGDKKLEIFAMPALWRHSFCRFTDSEPEVRIEVFAPAQGDPELKLRWRGSLQDILKKAKKDMSESAWKSKGCDRLNTFRLQGLALKVCSDSPENPLKNAAVLLSKAALYEDITFQSETDAEGLLVIPFGEPGPYKLMVIEDLEKNLIYETELKLEAGKIYTEDPRFAEDEKRTYLEMGALKIPVVMARAWTGDAVFEGIGQVYEHKEGGIFNETYNGNIYNASGLVKVSATVKSLTKKKFLKHCADNLFGGDFEDEASYEDIDNDLLPDLDKASVKFASEFLSRLRKDFQDVPSSFDFGSTMWLYPGEIPEGLILPGTELALDLKAVTDKVLELYFQGNYEGSIPYTIDIQIGWCVDASRLQEEPCEFLTKFYDFQIRPRVIPVRVVPTNDFKHLRLIAGPCAGEVRFAAHPSSPVTFLKDTAERAKGFSSVLIENKGVSLSGKIFAVGSRGELGMMEGL
ncbi:MAG: S8 family serine peptidase [Candidatus Aminicenantales bacterium]